MNIPVIAIKPYDAQNISEEVRKLAGDPVGWRTESIIKAIREKLREKYIAI